MPRALKARSNGEGSVYKMKRQNGRIVWRADSTVIRNGKRSVISGTGSTRQEAIDRRENNKIKREVLQGLRPASDLEQLPEEWKMTVGEWMAKVIEEKAIGEQSKAGLETKLRLHINGKGGIGDIPLRLLTATDVRVFIEKALPSKKAPDGSPLLSQGVIRSIYFSLKEACNEAVVDDKLTANPVLKVKAPEKHPLKSEGVGKLKKWVPHHLLKNIEGSPDEARWLLGFMALRQSEVLGLTDDCITFGKSPHVVIRQQLARHPTKHGCPWDGKKWQCGKQANNCPQRIGDGGLYIKRVVKTKHSERTLPLVEPFLSVMRAHMDAQKELRKSDAFSPLPGEDMNKLVFTNHLGRPRRQQDDNKAWRKLLEANKVPHMRGHLQRHMTVSILDAAGVPHSRIKDITGWSDASMMLVYAEGAPSELVGPLKQLGQEISKRRKS